ncbi:hypothetical protein CL655_00830 [bacterium]|nr:hypothetical protein [bacterium]|tara:strand:+ start:2526 stop:3467 length:942 start_codon:yes stop_codon:yes gene_type:complete
MDFALHVTNTDSDTLRVTHQHFGSFEATIPGRRLGQVQQHNDANITAMIKYDRRSGDTPKQLDIVVDPDLNDRMVMWSARSEVEFPLIQQKTTMREVEVRWKKFPQTNLGQEEWENEWTYLILQDQETGHIAHVEVAIITRGHHLLLSVQLLHTAQGVVGNMDDFASAGLSAVELNGAGGATFVPTSWQSARPGDQYIDQKAWAKIARLMLRTMHDLGELANFEPGAIPTWNGSIPGRIQRRVQRDEAFSCGRVLWWNNCLGGGMLQLSDGKTIMTHFTKLNKSISVLEPGQWVMFSVGNYHGRDQAEGVFTA